MGETEQTTDAAGAAIAQILTDAEANRLQLLEEFIARLRRLQRSNNAVKGYSQIIRRFYKSMDVLLLAAVTREHIEQFLWSRPLAPSTQRTLLATLQSFFKWLVMRRIVDTNPCDLVELPHVPKRLRHAPTYEDFCALCRQCWTAEEATILEVLYFTGLRMSEMQHLRERNVNLQTRRIRVIGKGNKERVVLFPASVADLLRQQMTGDPDHWVFPSELHPPYTRGNEWINGVLRRLNEKAGLPYKVTAHILRHGFIRLCKTRGIPLEVAAKLAGHANIQLTAMHYGQYDEDDLQRSYDEKIGG